ncbi:MAG: hypothetical protein K6A31_07995 [Fibrobacter sp.]|nr:hypothetical protein [Fibrobacter sp.]
MKQFRMLGLIVASCSLFFACSEGSSAPDEEDSSSSVAEESSSNSKGSSSDSKATSSDAKGTSSNSKETSSASKGTSSSSSAKVVLGDCATTEDSKLQAQINEATASLMNVVYTSEDAFKSVSNYESFRDQIAETEALFSAALKKDENNCAAQLGYALATVANLVNDPEVKSITDTILNGSTTQKYALVNIYQAENYASEIMESALQVDSTLITDRVQSIIESSALPTVQQALDIFKNLIDNDYRFGLTIDGNTLTLGKGEFQISAGALQATEAALTLLASYNLDASIDGSYNWIVNFIAVDNPHESESAYSIYEKSVQQIYHLMSDSTSFLTVKDAWKTKYASIPDMLDSAVGNVKNGLQTLLDSANSNTATSAALAISDGEMGDISTADVKKVITVLDSVQQAIRTSVTVTLGENFEIEICPKKFFTITDGIQDFFPYYKSVAYNEWLDFYYDSTSYVWASEQPVGMQRVADYILEIWFIDRYPHITSTYFGKNSGYYITDDHEFYTLKLDWDGCWLNVVDTVGPASDSISDVYPLEIIRPTICRTTESETLFAYISEETIPNLVYFTNAEGDTTISLTSFYSQLMDDEIDIDDVSDYIIFPDPTINGVFPNMTQEKMAYLFAVMLFDMGK